MNYRRALILVDGDLVADARAALTVLRGVAPQLDLLVIVAHAPPRWLGWFAPAFAESARLEDSLVALRELAVGFADTVDVEEVPELKGTALTAVCEAHDVDLVVLGGPGSLRNAFAVSSLRAGLPVAVLWARGSGRAIERVACAAIDARSRAAIEMFLREHANPHMHVTLLAARASPALQAITRQFCDRLATIAISTPADERSLRNWLELWTRTHPVDLVVLPRALATAFVGPLATTPVLLVPAVAAIPSPVRGALDVADVLDDGGDVRVLVDQVGRLGQLAPLDGEELALVVRGRVAATVTTRRGVAVVPPEHRALAIGLYRTAQRRDLDPLAAVEQSIVMVAATERPVLVFDAEVDEATFKTVAVLTDTLIAVPVRLRPASRCTGLRERLRAVGLPPTVLDARAVLDEGEALDVSEQLDAIRLARVVAALQRGEFRVAAFVYREGPTPAPPGCAALAANTLAAHVNDLRSIAQEAGTVSGPREVVPGNTVELELDNTTARRWLLAAIAGSTRALHLQAYIVADDELGRTVAEALERAADRGVAVRVLVDSLLGLHGSFGVQNPLLGRLADHPGIDLRVARPLANRLPSLTELKQRDHRKLVVADGTLALIGGRNLAREYYVGFDEVALTPRSPWREVPWLDAGARVTGPVVAELEASFQRAWCEAGGADFAVTTPPETGTTSARVVVHEGLRDAHTLELYRELIASAREHVYLVNGFPLVLELQHALLRALERGVRVRVLAGHVMPTHGSNPFAGIGAGARTAATALVHSRLDPIVAAGGEVYLLGLPPRPGWAPELGLVHPHVHAKVMTVDGQRCSVGSANMDITASYWESELVLVVEDPELTRPYEARIDTLMLASALIDREDPQWQQAARRRAWMRNWPGVLSL